MVLENGIMRKASRVPGINRNGGELKEIVLDIKKEPYKKVQKPNELRTAIRNSII